MLMTMLLAKDIRPWWNERHYALKVN